MQRASSTLPPAPLRYDFSKIHDYSWSNSYCMRSLEHRRTQGRSGPNTVKAQGHVKLQTTDTNNGTDRCIIIAFLWVLDIPLLF